MKELKKDSFIMIKPFMVTELQLKGNSLLIFALIYGITVNEGCFYGSIEYMQTWCNASNRNVLDCLKELIDKGLITKKKSGNTVFYAAKTIKESEESSQQSEESSLLRVKKVHSESEESSHNNIVIDNIKRESITISSDKPKNELPKLSDFNIESDKPSRSKSPYSVFYELHSKLYKQLVAEGKIPNKPLSYNYGLLGKRFKDLLKNPYFTTEKIMLGISNAVNDSSCIEQNFALQPILSEANLTRLIEGRYISTSKQKSDYQQKRQSDLDRGNLNTGNWNGYQIF